MKKLLAVALILLAAPCARADWGKSWDDAKKEGKDKNKLIILYFYSGARKDCKRFEEDILPKPEVASALEPYVLCKIDPEGPDADNFLWQKHGSPMPPALFIYEPQGDQLTSVLTLGANFLCDVLRHSVTAYFDEIVPAKRKLEKDPADPDALVALAKAYAKAENPDGCTANFGKAVEEYVKKGRDDDALKVIQAEFDAGMEREWYAQIRPAMRKVADLDPLNKTGLCGKAAWVEGLAACKEGKLKEAIAALQPACDKYTDADYLPKMMYALGAAYMYSKDIDNALKVFDKIIEKFPETDAAQTSRVQADKLRGK